MITEITGTTYSVSHYAEYAKVGDKNLFEEIIDQMMLDGLNPILQEKIKSLPLRDKRMNILAFLDKDRNLFMKIKSFISSEKLSKMEHLKEVILMLREYVKVGEVEKKKFGEVMTDLNLVKHILSRIPNDAFENPYNTFVDLANGTGVFPLVVIYRLMIGLEKWQPDPELRYKHIIENQIFISEIQPKNMFLYMCLVDPYDEYKLNIYTGSSLEEGFKKHMKEVWNKDSFNYSIGNPPFNQMIDMKFVRLSYEISEVTCIVHPSTWLLDEKGKQRAFNETKELVKDHLDNIELFNGNKIFNIALFIPCVITYINKSKKETGIKCVDKINNVEIYYDNIFQINKYSNRDIYYKLKSKILERSKNNNLLLNKNIINGDFYINTAQIRGNVSKNDDTKMSQDDFYTMVTRDTKVSNHKSKHMFFSFNSEEEANNFLQYTKSNFCRFCLSIYKNNSQLDRGELEIIPWLDFSREWIDEKLYKEFDLSGEEIRFIEKNIPKYYE